jgi:16S rRNA (cytosine1402-N4)-methyltransferase
MVRSGPQRLRARGHIMPDPTGHIPVMLEDVLHVLDPHPGETAVDGTIGAGGHAAAVAQRLGREGRLIGFDLDPSCLDMARSRLRELESGPELTLVHASFAGMGAHLARLGRRADVVLADLGFASMQVDDPARGLSFTADGPLDMRLDPTSPVRAADLVAALSERDLADLIAQYGEDPLARRIARKLAQTRTREPIETTAQLARLVREAYGPRARHSRMHPATRTFMALRIAVNDEIGSLRGWLESIRSAAAETAHGRDAWLQRGARIAVISFHSLEDRLVKHAWADMERQGWARRLTRRPVTPGEAEIAANPRARSAKLRAVMVDGPPTLAPRHGRPPHDT